LAQHIAPLRGINVNGQRTIPMARLRAMAKALGYARVETYIQTGNLLLESPSALHEVRRSLEVSLRATFGWEVAVAVRSPGDLGRVLAGCPYQPGEGDVVYVGFAATMPEPGRVAEAMGRVPGWGDSCTVGPEHVYILYRNGVHRSPLSHAFFERWLGFPMTSRNLGTVPKLHELASRRAATG